VNESRARCTVSASTGSTHSDSINRREKIYLKIPSVLKKKKNLYVQAFSLVIVSLAMHQQVAQNLHCVLLGNPQMI
jgi:hypothetical protein